MSKSVVLFAVTSLVSVAALADDPAPPPPPPFTGNLALTSNYKFRGQDQGSWDPAKTFRPAVQGGFDWTLDGFYLGNWNSSIGWLSGSSVEMDFYGGYRGEIVKDLGYDVGILRYQYVGSAAANTTEIYGAVSYGPGSIKYSHTVSQDYFGTAGTAFGSGFKGRNTGYLDLSVNYPVIDVLTINGHLGYTHFASALRDNVPDTNLGFLPSYYDYKIGVTYDLSKFAAGTTIAGAIVGANKKNSFNLSTDGTSVNKARFIVTLTKTL